MPSARKSSVKFENVIECYILCVLLYKLEIKTQVIIVRKILHYISVISLFVLTVLVLSTFFTVFLVVITGKLQWFLVGISTMLSIIIVRKYFEFSSPYQD